MSHGVCLRSDIASDVQEKDEEGIKTTLPLPDDFDFSKVDGKLIKQGLDIDDPLSKAIVTDCADYIGIGIYNIFPGI